MRRSAAAILVGAVVAGCAVTDGHVRPVPDLPTEYRDAQPDASGEPSIADRSWREVFTDPALQDVIESALAANHDLRIAAARVEESWALVGVSDARRGPRLDAAAGAGTTELSRSVLPEGDRTTQFASAGLFASWELDLWGRLRSLSAAARAEALSSEWSRSAVETTLVSQVALVWFELIQLDHQLEISRATLASREASLQLTRRREARGLGDLLDVRRAETLVETAAKQIPLLEEQIARAENALRFLAGDDPGPVRRGVLLVDQRFPDDLSLGTPAEILERRPDVRAAEADLSAAEADVDAARALFYPRVSLSAGAGFLTGEGTEFLDDSSRFTDSALAAVFPVFTSGELTSNLEAGRARRTQALVAYDRVIRSALRDVADAVVERTKSEERALPQRRLRDALADAARLARRRFEGGIDSYLSVLDAERDLFDAELDLSRAERDRLTSVVRLYRALGGGWGAESHP